MLFFKFFDAVLGTHGGTGGPNLSRAHKRAAIDAHARAVALRLAFAFGLDGEE